MLSWKGLYGEYIHLFISGYQFPHLTLSDTEIEEAIIYLDRVFEIYPPRGKLGEISYESFPGIQISNNDSAIEFLD
jgi:hypothetical protein